MNVPQVGNAGIDTQAAVRLRSDSQRPTQATSVKEAAAVPAGTSAETVQATTEQATPKKLTSEQIKEAVREINRALAQSNRALEFSVDEDSDRLIVRLKDGETGETIRQIPSDETLAIARYIADVQQGLLLRQKA